MADVKLIELPVAGMDCTECTQHVQHAIAALPGVEKVEVLLSSEKALIKLDPALVDLPMLRKAVEGAGYSVPDAAQVELPAAKAYSARIGAILAVVFGAVLFIVVIGEWLGLLEALTERVPFVLGAGLVILTGWPIFVNVVRAALRKQIISHTLMTLGVIAALAIGQWATAAVVVFFMRVGDYTEKLTSEGARRAVKDLSGMAPQTARIERDGAEVELPIGEVQPGDIVVVRPGEKIPVDGEVIGGGASIDQSSITGEAMPVEAGPGIHVYAATIARLGSLRICAERTGPDTTFGRVVKMVEEAEAHRADVQRFADRFSAVYLPIVAGLALLTFLIRRDPLATAAVLVVACSCSIALATPIAMLASIGRGAKQGLLVKGGKYLETLAHADVLLIDKTGTLTLGQPRITDIVALDGLGETEILALAASAERYSEHPLAEAVRAAGRARGIALAEPEGFEAMPGLGIRARVDGKVVTLGSDRLAGDGALNGPLAGLAAQGKTILYLAVDGRLAGALAAADTLRDEVPAALARVRSLGIERIELLTGDHESAASALAGGLGIDFRAGLLPEDKIRIVKEYQAAGHVVVMVGDGVNDAPALAQADVGIAMGAAGSDVAIEAAHIALMREDWALVPEALAIARRTMRVVRMNLIFTAIYNVVGLSLAALGFLPPVIAAAAQSLPDLGIMANSARLLRD